MAISVTRPHPFDHATARRRVDVLAQTLSRKLNLRTSWEGDRLSFKRTGARGHIDVTPDHIHVEISTSPLLPISDARLRQQVDAVLDEHIPPMPTASARDSEGDREHHPDATPEGHEHDEPEAPRAEDAVASPSARGDEKHAEDDAHAATAPSGSRTSGLLGAALQAGTASLNAAHALLFSPDQRSDLSEAQRARLEQVGQHLQQFREEAGLSLDDVSQRLGIDAAVLEAMERGTARLSLPLLRRLDEILPTIPSGWINRFIPPQPPDATPPDA